MTPSLHQRGSMALTMGLLLLGLVSILGLVEVGYLYWAKREVQKVADLAALSGAQRLETCANGNGDNLAARHNATEDNGFGGDLDIQCVYWAADATEHGDRHYTSPDSEHPRNAVRVKASLPLAPFFGFADLNGVGAEAIAANRGDPIASFSVGSRLLGLDTDDSVLQPLLGSVLGTSLGLKLLSYESIANSNISLLGLKNLLHLDAGTVDGILDTDIHVDELLDAVVTLIENNNDNTAEIDLNAVNNEVAKINAKVGDLTLKLGDILNVNAGTSNPDTALNVDVNAADIISAALQAANGRHAAALEVSNLDLIGLASVNLKLAIIEPPKLGIGRPGYNPDGTPRTLAHTAQIRLKLDAKLLDSPANDQTLINFTIPLLASVKVTFPKKKALLNIPLNLDLVPAEAWLHDMRCHIPEPSGVRDIATLKVRPGALNLFLGHLPDEAYENTQKRWQDMVDEAIESGHAYADLLNLRIQAKLLFGIISVVDIYPNLLAYASTPFDVATDGTHSFHIIPDKPASKQTGMTWSMDTGQQLLASALSALFTSDLLHVKLKFQDLNVVGIDLGVVGQIVEAVVNNLTPIVTTLLGILKPVLDPVFTALDQAVLGPLLKGLGVNVGAADVNLISVNCDTGVQLVY